jgi:putative DNA primase/helicase
MASAATIGRNLGGQLQHRNWSCSCPICDYTLSLADGEEGNLLAHCFGGCEWPEIEAALLDYGLYGDDDYEASPLIRVRRPDPEEIQHRINNARWLYGIAVDHPLVAAYLRSRLISTTSPVLRLIPQHWHRPMTGKPFPAMAAPIVDVAGEIIAIHLTFLKEDGSGLAYSKPAKGEIDHRRRCPGSPSGGMIRLAPYDPDRWLGIGEGIETTMSAMQLFNIPGWAAVNSGGLKNGELPTEIRRVLLIADNDANNCSQNNAIEGAERRRAEGREVCIWMPPTVGDDANDFLKKRHL